MVKTYQILHNAMFNTGSWIFSTFMSFVFLPYIVHKLGAEAYGVLVLVLSAVGYFAVLDLNLGDAVTKYVAEYTAEKDLKKINDTVGGVILLYLVLGVVGGVGILFLSETIVWRVLKIGTEFRSVAYFAFSVGSIGIIFTMLLTALAAIPSGLNRYDIAGKITMIMTFLTTIITVFLLYLGLGLKEIIILNVIISFLGCFLYAVIGKRLIAGLKLTPTINYSALRMVLKFGLFSSLNRISGIILFQGIRLLTGVILGASWVTYYVVPFSLISKGTAITFRLGVVIFPAISELQGLKRYERITDLYIQSSRIIICVSTAICLPLMFFGGRLLSLWMGTDFGEKSSALFFLLTLAIYLSTLTNVPSFVVDGMGKPKISGISSMSSAILNLALSIYLAKYMGINGIGLASLISTACVVPVFIWYVNNKVLHVSLLRLSKEAYAKPLLAALVMLIPLIAMPQNRIDSLLVLMVLMVIAMFGYLAVACLVGAFPRDERKFLYGYLGLVSRRVYSKL